MHDISDFERRGVPGVFAASCEFAAAAEAQGTALGFDPAAVFTRHPIQDRSDAEMTLIADAAFDDLLQALTAQP